MLSSILIPAFIASLATVAAASSAPEAPLPGYSVVEISWQFQTTARGPPTVLNGTVQEVYSQLVQTSPDYVVERFGAAESKRALQTAAPPKLSKRGDVHCGGFANAGRGAINGGIAYLRGVGGQPQRGPGPGNCGRVSCSDGSAIWWCNDNTFTKVLPGFYNIADGAQQIVDQCHQTNSYWVNGQNFIGGARDWNVVVRNDNC